MDQTAIQDVLIIGGSYAGLAAGMALGRSMRQVSIIDSGMPCNRQTPHAHNFITHDGATPAAIAGLAKEQVLQYPTINWISDKAVSAVKKHDYFEVTTAAGSSYRSRKLLFATGVKDHMPELDGFAACWGISVLHCPYCHGYEVKEQRLAVSGNGDAGFHLAMLIRHWTKDLKIFTGAVPAFSPDQLAKLEHHHIEIVSGPLDKLEHTVGHLKAIVMKDGSRYEQDALFARVPFSEHSGLPAVLGCIFDEQGLIVADEFRRTSVAGVYAAGDNCTMMRSLANAVAAGTLAGAMINRDLVEEDF